MTSHNTGRELKQKPQRSVEDFEQVCQFLDDGYVAHVGFFDPQVNEYVVIPMGYVRDKRRLLFHGQSGSRFLRTLTSGVRVCATITLLDGLVVARTPLNSSMNYRSVMVFGDSYALTGEEKTVALIQVSERLVPGLWDAGRELTAKEIASTAVVAIDLDDWTAKQRQGGALDAQDHEAGRWAGYLPLEARFGSPIPNAEVANVEPPTYVARVASRPVNGAHR